MPTAKVQAKNLIGLIREVKPRTALFTTYTLSLSFVEAVLLPILRHVGCKDIAILVDAKEAAASLEEAHARYAGRRYWIAHVIAPGGGIFHPKLAYFVGDTSDVLVVGSGNLTLPGQGGQLETMDAVSSVETPEVFRQFSAFAQGLAERIDSTSQVAADLLREYGERAKFVTSAARNPTKAFPDVPSLVHSLDEAPCNQFVSLWTATGNKANQLTVLSPFHVPDGGPIRRLADILDVKRIQVGICNKTLIAPLVESEFKPKQDCRYVKTDEGDRPRSLHAKVFEVASPSGCLTVTGSINSTHQSLEAKKNVEVSLARWSQKPIFAWEVVKPIRFEPNTFEPLEKDVSFAFVEATLDRGGVIRGRLSGRQGLPENVEAHLVSADGSTKWETNTTKLRDGGQFSFGPVRDPATSAPIQLEISATGLRATCWLNVLDDLTATDEEQRERRAIRDILRGDFTTDDVVELLQILYRSAHEAMTGPAVERTSSKSEKKTVGDEADKQFSYLRWQMSGTQTRARGLLGLSDGSALKAVIRWLNADSPNQSNSGGSAQHPQAVAEVSHRQFRYLDEEQRGRSYVDIQQELGKLIEAIPMVLQKRNGAEFGVTLALVAGAYALKQMANSPWHDSRALAPVLLWLDDYSRFEYAENGRDALLGFALGAAAITAARARELDASIQLGLLKEALLRFSPQWSELKDLHALLSQQLGEEIFNRVGPALRNRAAASLSDIWAAESIDDRIVRLVEMSRSDTSRISTEDEAMFPGVFASLRAQTRRRKKVANDGVITSESRTAGCPHCYQQLDESTRRALRSRHAIVCPNSFCGKVILFLGVPSVAKQVKEVIARV